MDEKKSMMEAALSEGVHTTMKELYYLHTNTFDVICIDSDRVAQRTTICYHSQP